MFHSVVSIVEIVADCELITVAIFDDKIIAYALKRRQFARLNIDKFNRIGLIGACLVIANRINAITDRKLIGVIASTTIQCVVAFAADE